MVVGSDDPVIFLGDFGTCFLRGKLLNFGEGIQAPLMMMFGEPCIKSSSFQLLIYVSNVETQSCPLFVSKSKSSTLPETNSSHLKMDAWNEYQFPFGIAYFQGLC